MLRTNLAGFVHFVMDMQLSSFPFFLILIIYSIISLILVWIAIPSIIHVARHFALFDENDSQRKKHQGKIPRLGGVAIFCSFMIVAALLPSFTTVPHFNILFSASVILFAVGLKDDLWGVNPSTKFGMQFIISSMMVLLGNVRLTSLYGIFNIYDMPYTFSILFSILLIIFLINSFNLIDGIDGLAGTTGLVVSITFGIMFMIMNQSGLAGIAFILACTCAGFLRFNITPAKIFMGDTGSLFIGFISAVLAIQFIELNKVGASFSVHFSSAPSIAIAVLIGPIFDALRVFILRILKKGSPFTGDRNHIHHRVLKMGFNHLQTTLILMLFNILMIIMALVMKGLGNFILIGILFAICLTFNALLTYLIRSKERKSFRLVNFLW